MTGVGGDAFVLLGSAAEGRVVGLNGSGRAPAGASVDAYRARGLGAIAPGGILSATVPGAVHAWEALSRRFGALPLATVLEPAIRAADGGFPVTELVAHIWDLLQRLGALRNDAARASWLAAGRAPRAGEWFRAPGLARTLRQIAEGGAAAFYEGEAARAIVAASRDARRLLRDGRPRATHLDVGPADRDDVSGRRGAGAAAERPGPRRAAGAEHSRMLRPARRRRARSTGTAASRP